jgi:ABC-type sugar transport system ATPase subunit
VGQNGAGKSTALGLLAGRIAPTAGRVELFGEEMKYGDPRAARGTGVVAIYQELTVVPDLSVEANVFLGQVIARRGFLSTRAMRARYEALCEEAGVAAHPPRTQAGLLSVADQQVLEILRALVGESRLMLFDEPTASLAIPEREALHRVMRTLRDRGMTIVFVSHNLDEVLMLSDTVTVFREGQLIRSAPRESWSKAKVVQGMLGESADARFKAEMLNQAAARDRSAPSPSRRPANRDLLRAEGLTVPGAIADVDVTVRAGEVLGIAGLVGAGRTTLLRALAGSERTAEGALWVDGERVPWPRTVRRARALGVALLPEDRKNQGLVPSLSATENILLSRLSGASRFGFVSSARLERAAAGVAPGVGFSTARLSSAARQLSGGNQQKLLMARWTYDPPKVLLADEPTRGVDIGAKAEILGSLERMAERGIGVVIVSSELEELAAVSDRVLVLAGGRAVAALDRTEGEISVSDILHSIFEVDAAA